MGLLLMWLSHDPTIKQQKHKEAKTPYNITRSRCWRHYKYMMIPARIVIVTFSSFYLNINELSLYKGLRADDNKKKTKNFTV